MRTIRQGLLVALATVLCGVWTPAAAQVDVSSADIQRLQDSVFDVGAEIARLRARDGRQADALQAELDTTREDVIYLKVKLRRGERVSRGEYAEIRDHLEDLRARARGDASLPPRTGSMGTPPARPVPMSGRRNEVPVGTEIDVRLQDTLNSKTAEVEDRFTATTLVDLTTDNGILIPAGSLVRGVVTSVDRAGRLDRRGRLTVAFDQITVDGRSYPIRATVTQALESEGIRGEAAKIGTGAGVGAIIGGIIGGVKGALAGILIGAGGTVAATEGNDVELPAGTILRLRFDSPLVLGR